MNGNSTTVGSLIMLGAAVLSWGLVGFFVMTVVQMQTERGAYMADAAQTNLQEGQAAQLRALARETENDRTQLQNIASVEVLSAVNMIESVHASGTSVRVTSAQPVRANPKAAPQQLNVVDLSAHAEGTFSSIMRVLRMLETLPLATTIQDVNFSHAPADSVNPKSSTELWGLNIKLRFYTTAPLST